MFTGIIEGLGTVRTITTEGTNKTFTLTAPFVSELKVDQSLAHNGVCLTVTNIRNDEYSVTAIDETLNRTNLGELKIGEKVNLERCTPVNGRLDGHIVQGHVDLKGICESVKELKGSWLYYFCYEQESIHYTVEKGSICINGVSLTVVDSRPGRFSVAIIPFTHEHTTFHQLQPNDTVNLEFDIIGKYVAGYMDRMHGK
jgi:riboflavin synthase